MRIYEGTHRGVAFLGAVLSELEKQKGKKEGDIQQNHNEVRSEQGCQLQHKSMHTCGHATHTQHCTYTHIHTQRHIHTNIHRCPQKHAYIHTDRYTSTDMHLYTYIHSQANTLSTDLFRKRRNKKPTWKQFQPLSLIAHLMALWDRVSARVSYTVKCTL